MGASSPAIEPGPRMLTIRSSSRGDEDNSCSHDELFELRQFVIEQPVLIFFSAAIGQGELAAMAGVACENVRQKIVTRSSTFYKLNNRAALERELES
jgi:hypothetical protein